MTAQKAGTSWGDNNPKPTAWVACEKALTGSEKESGGVPKTVGILKSCWQKVGLDYVCVCAYLTICSSKRNMILSKSSAIYQDLAGTMWQSMSRQLQLYGTSTPRCTWLIYMWGQLVLLTCPPLFSEPWQGKPFHKKGFPLFDKISNLIDSTCATGEFAFQAGQTPGPSNTQHSSPATPSGDDFESQINPVLLSISKDITLSCRPGSPSNWENNKYSKDDTPNEVKCIITTLAYSSNQPYSLSSYQHQLQWQSLSHTLLTLMRMMR